MPNSTTRLVFGVLSSCLLSAIPAHGQPIQADSTLTPNNTVVVPLEPDIYGITGGTEAGPNLFHSFREFSVPEVGGAVFFNDNPAIQNVIGRVTGSSISAIEGFIEAAGGSPNFNLFLLNPNGIVFGPNASLNVGGAFVATTADSLVFDNGGEFSATNPQPPLLRVNVPLGLQFGQNPGPILVRGAGLPGPPDRIPQGNTFALVGGNVTLQGAALAAPDGRIEVGSVGGGGRVALTPHPQGFEFRYAPGQNLQAIRLQEALLDASGPNGGGNIQLRGNTIAIDNSGIFVAPSPMATQPGGDITLHADRVLTIENGSAVQTITSGPVAGGNIRLRGETVNVRNGLLPPPGSPPDTPPTPTQVAAETEGIGRGGNLAVVTDLLQVDNFALMGTETRGSGQGGDVTIEARRLGVNNSQIGANSLGGGDTGNLTVNVSEAIELRGNLGRLITETGAGGTPGNIVVNTGQLNIQGGAGIATSTSTSTSGLQGNVRISATEINIEGVSREGTPSSITTRVEPGSTAKGGDVAIETEVLQIRDRARINTSTADGGSGAPSGTISITARDRIDIQGNLQPDQISTGLLSQVEPEATGRGGNIVLNTNQLNLQGDGATISSATGGLGSGGNITLQTGELRVGGGAQIAAATLGEAPGGTIDVISESVRLAGISADTQSPSGLFTSTGTPDRPGEGTARAGNIRVRTGQLQISDGARISASSQNLGRGGTVTVSASEQVELTGTSADGFFRSGIFAEGRSLGSGGNISVATPNLNLDRGATITAETASDDGGNLNLQVGDTLELRRGSTISATAGLASSRGNGGNIDIVTQYLFALPQENSDITANAFFGRGGNIDVTAEGIFGIEFREQPTPLSDMTVSSAFGVDGVVTVNNPDTDPNQGLADLPDRPIDPTRLVAQDCRQVPGFADNRFIITGRGGLPPNPSDVSSFQTPLEDLGEIALEERDSVTTRNTEASPPKTSIAPPVEARGWVVHPDGKVILVAHASGQPVSIPWLAPQCRTINN
ncbi:S-layer family protein [Lyngbya sp. CCY1209]|uniref:S-layer family protein n=1 Tax=Lyngbya sp. CCY1209 TaxID=2886103 RepID=UPI002D20C337|nr:S-layer family protein [Lyngbya sp. CCY1209]MEB3883178.1 S-layer family protein [Lyngbya sp. CCY1209]